MTDSGSLPLHLGPLWSPCVGCSLWHFVRMPTRPVGTKHWVVKLLQYLLNLVNLVWFIVLFSYCYHVVIVFRMQIFSATFSYIKQWFLQLLRCAAGFKTLAWRLSSQQSRLQSLHGRRRSQRFSKHQASWQRKYVKTQLQNSKVVNPKRDQTGSSWSIFSLWLPPGRWAEIQVGNFVKLTRDQPVPADLLLVFSSPGPVVILSVSRCYSHHVLSESYYNITWDILSVLCEKRARWCSLCGYGSVGRGILVETQGRGGRDAAYDPQRFSTQCGRSHGGRFA